MALAARGFQTTFQVDLPDRPVMPPYHARRAHKKSRHGCTICKSRRVKVSFSIQCSVFDINQVQCDERRPACLRCENYGAECVYPPSPTSSRTSSSPSSSSSDPDRTLVSFSISDMVSKVQDAVGADLAFAPRAIGDYDAVINIAVTSLNFYLKYSTDTVGTPAIKQVMKRDMIHVAFDVGCSSCYRPTRY